MIQVRGTIHLSLLVYPRCWKPLVYYLGNNHLIFMGGGQDDLSEPENFFFCLFLEQENFFFAGPSGRTIFFKKPHGAHFIKPWGEGGGGLHMRFFQTAQYFRFIIREVIPKVYNVVFWSV